MTADAHGRPVQPFRWLRLGPEPVTDIWLIAACDCNATDSWQVLARFIGAIRTADLYLRCKACGTEVLGGLASSYDAGGEIGGWPVAPEKTLREASVAVAVVTDI